MLSEGYIGITTRAVKRRWYEHKTCALSENKKQLPFSKALIKHGFDNFIVDTLWECTEYYARQIEFKLRPKEFTGYNSARGGQKNILGRVVSAEERQKTSIRLKGIPRTAEVKAKVSKAMKGRELSPEHKLKFTTSRVGHKITPENSRLQSIRQLGLKTMTDDGKRRLAEKQSAIVLWERHNSNLEIMSKFLEFFDAISTETLNNDQLAYKFGYKRHQVRTCYKKLATGWNPHEDEKYLTWLSAYQERLHDGTSATTFN